MRWLLIPLIVYASWLGMMAVHESGHALHAWLSGGTVTRVTVPLVGFSRTDISPNPSPRFVTWGGPVWGSILPLMLFLVIPRTRRGIRHPMLFFAGLCCVVNGAYIGLGWLMPDGDAADLRKHGEPLWTMIAFGAIAFSTGLWLWHRMGPRFGLNGRAS